MPPVQFLQDEISVRESINALPQYENLTPEEMGAGTDIGGGETLWGDGSITGSNTNGTYTKWPNGDLTGVGNGTVTSVSSVNNRFGSTAGSIQHGSVVVTLPYTSLITVTASTSGVSGFATGSTLIMATTTNNTINVIFTSYVATTITFSVYFSGTWK